MQHIGYPFCYLTLTSVVFEYLVGRLQKHLVQHLTLTSVVFELVLVVIMYLQVVNLTLTSVVFESKILNNYEKL